MSDDAVGVKVSGLKELRKTLKALENVEGAAELKTAFVEAGGEILTVARAKAGADGSKWRRQTASAASRARVVRSAARGAITIGGRPFDVGNEFGAYHNQPRSVAGGTRKGWNTLPPVVGYRQTAGRWLYPAIRQQMPETVEIVADALMRIAEQAGR